MWRLALAAAVATVVGSGCASVVGLDFERYDVAPSREGDGAQCVPHVTLRCLCALAEGFQTCSESGRLSACECRDASSTTAPVSLCGNGTIDDGEACDDGNLVSNDGCSTLCTPDGRPAAVDSCPGQPIELPSGRAVRIDVASFARGSDDTSESCGLMAQPDRVYAVRPSWSGTLAIAVASDAALALEVRTTCATPATALSCDAAAAGVPVSRRIQVEAGQTYFVIIEPRQTSAQASYSLSFGGP